MWFFRSIRFVLLLMLMGITAVYSGEKDNQPFNKSSVIIQLEIDGVIGPATADYIVRNLQKAVDSHAIAVLIQMDTPGGLDTSMRQIIKQITAEI